MLTSKQRAYLRSMANALEPIFQIGKGGVNENMLKQLEEVLEKRELIKIHILENSMLDTKPTCNMVADTLKAEPIQAIGSKFVLYKQSKDNKQIVLPK